MIWRAVLIALRPFASRWARCQTLQRVILLREHIAYRARPTFPLILWRSIVFGQWIAVMVRWIAHTSLSLSMPVLVALMLFH